MRIGLDARFLTHPQFGGFKTYTTNLVPALAALDRENEYVVYVDREPGSADAVPRQANFTYRAVPGAWPVVGMPWREQIGLRRQIAADRLDLVHFLCNTATIGLRTPHIVTLHDRMQLRPQPLRLLSDAGAARRWAIATYSRHAILPVLTSAWRVIAVSRHEAEGIASDYRIPEERIAVTLEAAGAQYRRLAEPERRQAQRDLASRLGITTPFLVTVGFEARKQIPTAIRALAQLGASHADLSLVVVAAAPDRHAAFHRLATELGIGGRVVVLGARTGAEMVVLYNLAEAFVFPSEREGFGLPPLEAMACGAPVIARRSTSVPEIVGDAGILVDGGDAEAWAAAIARVRTTPGIREDLCRRGLARAGTFTWRRCAEQTLDVYQAAGRDSGVAGVGAAS